MEKTENRDIATTLTELMKYNVRVSIRKMRWGNYKITTRTDNGVSSVTTHTVTTFENIPGVLENIIRKNQKSNN